MASDTVFAIPGENSQVQVLNDDNEWMEVDGSGDVSVSPSAAPVTEVANYRGTFAHTGKERPPSASIPITTYMPHNPVWDVLSEDKVREFRILWGEPDAKYTKPSSPVLMGAIATTGALTFSGTTIGAATTASFLTGDYGRNLVVVIGGTSYVVTRIAGSVITVVEFGTTKIARSTALTAAEVDLIVVPAVQYNFSASITTFAGISNPTDGVANTTLEIKLSNPWPKRQLVTAKGDLYL